MLKRIVFAHVVFCVAVVALLCGCTRDVSDIDAVESNHPLVRRAHDKVKEGDNDAAILLLKRALRQNSELAKAHLDLAILYGDYRKDYVRAIYHYQTYLELRPDTQKRDMIEGLISEAKLKYAASVSAKVIVDQRLQSLRKENDRLKSDLQSVKQNLAELKKNETRVPVARRQAPEPQAPAPVVDPEPPPAAVVLEQPEKEGEEDVKVEIYYIRPNDTLSTISAAVYGDAGQWKKIYEANRDTLPDSDKLRVGQALIIPR